MSDYGIDADDPQNLISAVLDNGLLGKKVYSALVQHGWMFTRSMPDQPEPSKPMHPQDRDAIIWAASIMGDAIGIWPQKHPAAGMVMGIQEQSDQTYRRLRDARDRLLGLLTEREERQ